MSTGTETAASRRVIRSDRPDVRVPDVSLPEFLLGAAAERADHPALVDGGSGRSLSYGELAAEVRRCAAGLAAHGLRHGDVLAIMAPNSPEWLVACYGTMTAGGIVTGMNPLSTPPEVARHLTSSRARFLLTVPPFLPTARAAVELAGGSVEIILVGPESDGVIPFAELLTHGDAPPPVDIDPATDLALLPYSSGTSGLPKGVMLTHRACVANAVQQQESLPSRPDDRALAVAPFFHATGFGCVANASLHAGSTVVTMPRFEVESFLELIQTHRATTLVLVPPIALALSKHPAVDRYDLSSLRWIAVGAAPVGAELQEACTRRLGCLVLQGYGMTEMTAAITLWPPDLPVVFGAAGTLMAGIEARVVDVGTGADLPPGETGELWLRGPAMMEGYRDDPAATAATIDADGWLHTGDIARVTEDGAVFIVDRVKELIKVKAFQVAPAELEAVLKAHPAVAEAAVVGVPDERAGERPKAFVVRTAAGTATADELIDHVGDRVAPYKRLHAVEFVDSIPTSPSGKLLRRLLRG